MRTSFALVIVVLAVLSNAESAEVESHNICVDVPDDHRGKWAMATIKSIATVANKPKNMKVVDEKRQAFHLTSVLLKQIHKRYLMVKEKHPNQSAGPEKTETTTACEDIPMDARGTWAHESMKQVVEVTQREGLNDTDMMTELRHMFRAQREKTDPQFKERMEKIAARKQGMGQKSQGVNTKMDAAKSKLQKRLQDKLKGKKFGAGTNEDGDTNAA